MEEAQEPQKLIIVIKNDKKMIVVIDGTTIFSIGLNGQKENTTVLVFFRTEGSANFIIASDEAKKIERWSYWQEKDSAASLCFEKLLSVYKVADKCNVEGV